MPLCPSVSGGDDQVRLRQHCEMFHDPEASHFRKLLAQLIERLPVPIEERIQYCPPGWVGECPKYIASCFHDSIICDLLVTYQAATVIDKTADMNSLLERLFVAWTSTDDLAQVEDRFAALYTDPVRVNGTDISPADLVSRARSLHGAFSGLRAELLQVVEDKESIAVAFVMHGWHTGPYQTPFGIIQPTGVKVQIRTIDVLTISNDTISAIWVTADDLGTLRQLGWQP
jgi:predicted ester cyclase